LSGARLNGRFSQISGWNCRPSQNDREISRAGLAVDLINRQAVDMKPLLTGCYGLDDVQMAFELAGDRSRSMKVQLSF
jgi:threonine dehydrogenase-like Zn-dependent dehydrogenase